MVFLFAIVLVFALGSCNEAPTEMGMNLLHDTVSVVFVAGENNVIKKDTSYIIPKSTSLHTGSFLVGKAKGNES